MWLIKLQFQWEIKLNSLWWNDTIHHFASGKLTLQLPVAPVWVPGPQLETHSFPVTVSQQVLWCDPCESERHEIKNFSCRHNNTFLVLFSLPAAHSPARCFHNDQICFPCVTLLPQSPAEVVNVQCDYWVGPGHTLWFSSHLVLASNTICWYCKGVCKPISRSVQKCLLQLIECGLGHAAGW